jgi:hypothetical protein
MDPPAGIKGRGGVPATKFFCSRNRNIGVGRKVGAPATEFFLIWVSVEIRQISYLGPGEGQNSLQSLRT